MNITIYEKLNVKVMYHNYVSHKVKNRTEFEQS